MQQSCHCSTLIFSETRPCCVCCSQHVHSQLFPTEIWLRILPRKHWGLACQAQPFYGVTACLCPWWNIFPLAWIYSLKLCLHVLFLPWQVTGMFCELSACSQALAGCSVLAPGKLWLLLANSRLHSQALVWAGGKQDLATAPGAPTLSVGLGLSVAELSVCDVCMCCKSTLNGKNAPIYGLFSLGNLGVFMVEQPRAVAFHCHWLLHCGVNSLLNISHLGQLQELQQVLANVHFVRDYQNSFKWLYL